MNVICRQCGSSKTLNRGAMIRADMFCGLKLAPVWPGGHLYECTQCHLVYRFPIRDKNDYLELYKNAPEITYQNCGLRHDQILVRKAILNNICEDGAVLDIGCFDGTLLKSLGSGIKKYGIEAAKSTSELCREAGINIVAENAEQLETVEIKFDVICLVDVVEHLVDPLGLINVAIAKLKNDGYLIISTGNASNPVWRFFGGRYWYCSFPEHISFISPEWIESIIEKSPLILVETLFFPHKNPNVGKVEAWFRFLGRAAKAYVEIVCGLFDRKRAILPSCKLGFPGVVNDHMLLTLKLSR